MTLSEYDELKHQVVISVGSSQRHKDMLNSLKDMYKESINSVRRFEQITSIGQLIKVLELRGMLSEDNVVPLKDIAQRINNNEILKKINDYGEYYVHKDISYNFSTPKPYKETKPLEVIINPIPYTSNTMSSRKIDNIIQTVVEEIGCAWRSLARNLKVRECIIDEIDAKHTTLSSKAREMLKVFEKRSDPQNWFFVLCNALEQTRRKALARRLQEIASMNI